MARPRLTDAEKQLKGTFIPCRGDAALAHGRVRLSAAVPAPKELDADARREWNTHMLLLVQAGTVSAVDLRAMVTLAKVAALCERAYALASQSSPMVRTKEGIKQNPCWTTFCDIAALYLRWCDRFGLVPMGARMLPQLPPARGTPLRTVG